MNPIFLRLASVLLLSASAAGQIECDGDPETLRILYDDNEFSIDKIEPAGQASFLEIDLTGKDIPLCVGIAPITVLGPDFQDPDAQMYCPVLPGTFPVQLPETYKPECDPKLFQFVDVVSQASAAMSTPVFQQSTGGLIDLSSVLDVGPAGSYALTSSTTLPGAIGGGEPTVFPAIKSTMQCARWEPDSAPGVDTRVAAAMDIYETGLLTWEEALATQWDLLGSVMAGSPMDVPENVEVLAVTRVDVRNHCAADEIVTLSVWTPPGGRASPGFFDESGQPFVPAVRKQLLELPGGWELHTWIFDRAVATSDEGTLDAGELVRITQRGGYSFSKPCIVEYPF